jgi:hypothetical protein
MAHGAWPKPPQTNFGGGFLGPWGRPSHPMVWPEPPPLGHPRGHHGVVSGDWGWFRPPHGAHGGGRATPSTHWGWLRPPPWAPIGPRGWPSQPLVPKGVATATQRFLSFFFFFFFFLKFLKFFLKKKILIK